MSDDLDELSYDVELDGTLIRRTLDKQVIVRGAWATLLFLYEEREARSGEMSAPKIAVVRLQRRRGGWRKHASFVLSSAAQAEQLREVLARWAPRMTGEDEVEPADTDELA